MGIGMLQSHYGSGERRRDSTELMALQTRHGEQIDACVSISSDRIYAYNINRIILCHCVAIIEGIIMSFVDSNRLFLVEF